MKLFEIGNGLISIKAPSKYYSDWENEETVILYTGSDTDIWIRVSVVSVAPKDKSADNIFDTVIKNGSDAGYAVKTEDDKSYYRYISESEEEATITFFYEIGYKFNYIIISLTTLLEKKDDAKTINALKDIEDIISTISEISLEDSNIFEPKYTDFDGINERVSNILNISKEQINDLHKDEKTLPLIQSIIDRKLYDATQTYKLQSLGIAMGDYMQYKNPDFHWAIVRDEYGRDLCLQYQDLAITSFPMTMISKRIEDGKIVNVKTLVDGLFAQVKDVADNGEHKKLDYNY